MQVEFGSLFQFIRNGMNVKQDKSGDGLPITRIETISDATVDAGRVGYAGLSNEDCDGWLLERGDILFSHINSVEHVGKCAIYECRPEKLVHGMNLLCLRCDQNKLLPEFAKYLIRSPAFRTRLSNFINKAVNQASVSIGNLKSIPVAVPPLPEQRRIAAILDQADALRAKRREALAQLDELQKAIFIEMFGDPVTNPKGWPRKPIQTLCGASDDIKCGPFGTQLAKSEVTEEGVPLWGIKNVNAAFRLPAFEYLPPKTANRLKSYGITAGDIVMTRKGTVGNCAVYPQGFPDGVMHSDLLRIRTDAKRCLPVFLSHQLHHSKDVERQLALISGGAVMPGINVTKLKSIEVLVPAIEQQQEFLKCSSAVDELRINIVKAMDDLNSLFASLQHRAFRGEL